jgi:hypothetical protein
MSEWHGSQQKPNGSLRKLLYARMGKVNIRHTKLTIEEQKPVSNLGSSEEFVGKNTANSTQLNFFIRIAHVSQVTHRYVWRKRGGGTAD